MEMRGIIRIYFSKAGKKSLNICVQRFDLALGLLSFTRGKEEMSNGPHCFHFWHCSATYVTVNPLMASLFLP